MVSDECRTAQFKPTLNSGHATILLQIFLQERYREYPTAKCLSELQGCCGNVSGARVTGQDISCELGRPYIWADGINMTRNRVAAHGCDVVEVFALQLLSSTGWLVTFCGRANVRGLTKTARA